MQTKNKLVVEFLSVASIAARTFPGNYRHFCHYMNISFAEFFQHAERFTAAEVQHAIDCIHANEWDQSNFIMAAERS